MLRERIGTAMKAAMKKPDGRLRVATLRLVSAAIKDRDILARSEDRCDGVPDEEILRILAKMVRQREDSIKAYEAGCRPELAEQERAEIDIIREFMPRQLTDTEVRQAVQDIVDEFGASGLKDMGKCMGALKQRHDGTMNFGYAGTLLKERLC